MNSDSSVWYDCMHVITTCMHEKQLGENPMIGKRTDEYQSMAELTQMPISAKSVNAPCAVHERVFPTAPHHPVSTGVIQLPINHQTKANVISYTQSPAMILWYESTLDLWPLNFT